MSEKTSNPFVLTKTIRELTAKISNAKKELINVSQEYNSAELLLNQKEQEFNEIYKPLVANLPIYRNLVNNIDNIKGNTDNKTFILNQFDVDNGTRTSFTIGDNEIDPLKFSYEKQKLLVSKVEIPDYYYTTALTNFDLLIYTDSILKYTYPSQLPHPSPFYIRLTIYPQGHLQTTFTVENEFRVLQNGEVFTEPDVEGEKIYFGNNFEIITPEPIYIVFEEKKEGEPFGPDCVRFEGATPDIPAFVGYAGE